MSGVDIRLALRNLHENLELRESGAAFARVDQLNEVITVVIELLDAAKIGRFYLADVASDPFHVDQEAARLHLQQVDAALAKCKGLDA